MALLLDTCAMIWIATDSPVAPAAYEAIEREVSAARPARVSPISAWEIGMLVAGNRINLAMAPTRWFHRFVDRPDVELAELTPDILIAAWFLPGVLHRDPADRILCATAREGGYTIVTRDRKILEYAAAGHCRALAC
jgi:PIN domain nuclease of toxin-antitoxin system